MLPVGPDGPRSANQMPLMAVLARPTLITGQQTLGAAVDRGQGKQVPYVDKRRTEPKQCSSSGDSRSEL